LFLLFATQCEGRSASAIAARQSNCSFAVETLLTFFLVTVTLGVAPKGKLVGNNMAIFVGGTIALCGLFAGRISGASMNPALSLAPYLVSG
jgi:aquaporin Z